MSTLAEIEAATAGLTVAELQHLERTVHALYKSRGHGLIYDDAYGTVSDEDLIAEADAAFLAYDRAEEKNGGR
jgi:hypothetical protein